MGLSVSMRLFADEYGKIGMGNIVSVGLIEDVYSNMQWALL